MRVFGTLLLILLAHNVKSETKGEALSRVVKGLKSGYDKDVRPNHGGQAVELGVSMYILGVHGLDEMAMNYEMNLYFRQFWNDPRLQFSKRGVGEKIVLTGNQEWMWAPDTFCVNCLRFDRNIGNIDNSFVRIMHNGDVLKSVRATVKASCPLYLRHWPKDDQICFMEIESFGFTMNDIIYKWRDGPEQSVQMSSDVSLPEYRVQVRKAKTIEAALSTGNYSRLTVEIDFKKSYGYYYISLFFPSIFMAILSWLCTWLNAEDFGGFRVASGTVVSVAMVLFHAWKISGVAKISYIKFGDMFMLLGTIFSFLNLIASVIMIYLCRRTNSVMEENGFKKKNGGPKICGRVPVWCIDATFKIVLPVIYVLSMVINCAMTEYSPFSIMMARLFY